MINTRDILETIKMIEEEHLDIRTITMGISLRDLAADAGVNPNTVQRAFAELERLGLIYTQRTSGKFVTEDAAAIDAARRALAEGQTRQYLAAMSALGFDRAALITFLNQMEETKDANS